MQVSAIIGELCVAIAHRWEPERIFVILTAYLDESGTHDGSPVTVMAGMLANARQWEAFERDFRLIKARHRFQIFHTKKFKKKDGDFAGWTDGQCLALMSELAPLTATAFTEGVSVTLDNTDYEAEFRAGEKPRRMRLDSRYGFCFRNCLIFFAIEGLKRVHRGQYPKLHFVLESGHKNAGDALRIFNEVKAELEANGCDMLCDLLFADKDKCDPLMMADFLAHTAYMMGQAGGRAPDHWKVPTEIQKIPQLTRGRSETGVTHLRFKPGGLAELKSVMIDQLKAKNASVKRPASEGQSS